MSRMLKNIKKLVENKHDRDVGIAMRIIEDVVEPLMYTMAVNISKHPNKSRRQIIGELKKGMEGEAYYEMEDKILAIIR